MYSPFSRSSLHLMLIKFPRTDVQYSIVDHLSNGDQLLSPNWFETLVTVKNPELNGMILESR